MKVFAILMTLTLGLVIPAEAKQSQQVSVKINHEKAARGGLRIRFAELIEDSRCPRDTNCVWEGNAKIKVRVARNGRSRVIELNTSGGSQPVEFAGYRFRLTGLTPEPRSNIRINRNGYVATIEAEKLK